MQFLDLTLDTPGENVALDEALLDAAEAGQIPGGVLRLWESPQLMVVLGRSSRVEVEVDLPACRRLEVPVWRRVSGGGTVVAGPGCLMYALVLPRSSSPQLRGVDGCHQFVLQRMTQLLAARVPGVAVAGTSDLVCAVAPQGTLQKFSGNALRCKRGHILYHGTLLYRFDVEQLGRLLATPTRTPVYRDGRSHTQFVTNLPLTRSALASALIIGWAANTPLANWPRAETAELVAAKYTQSQWCLYQPGPVLR